MNSYDPPIKVTIPTPGTFSIGYGPNSTGGRGGNMRARCTNKEYDLLAAEAKSLGISLAKALQKHREDNSTNDETEIENDKCRS